MAGEEPETHDIFLRGKSVHDVYWLVGSRFRKKKVNEKDRLVFPCAR